LHRPLQQQRKLRSSPFDELSKASRAETKNFSDLLGDFLGIANQQRAVRPSLRIEPRAGHGRPAIRSLRTSVTAWACRKSCRQAIEALQRQRALKQAAVHHYVGVAGLNQVRGSGDLTAGRTEQRDVHRPAFGKSRARFSQGAARSKTLLDWTTRCTHVD
jgi:hypothetical protein